MMSHKFSFPFASQPHYSIAIEREKGITSISVLCLSYIPICELRLIDYITRVVCVIAVEYMGMPAGDLKFIILVFNPQKYNFII